MSNSYKKTPIMATTTCDSEKQDKRNANRKLRRIVKHFIKCGKFDVPRLREISNIWAFGKDGKCYLHKTTNKKWLRK